MTLPPESPTTVTTTTRRLINPVALVFGLLYVAIGLGALAEQAWGDIDLTAIAGIGAVIAGTAVITLITRRRWRTTRLTD